MRARRALAALLAAGALLAGGRTGPARAATRWLEPGRSFAEPVADPREPRMGFEYFEGGAWTLRAGGRETIAHVESSDLRVGIDGMAWLWFGTAPRLNFPLETVDGFAGAWVERRVGRWAGRVRVGHHSGHLADGAPPGGPPRRAYSRESVQLLGACSPRPGLDLYGGPELWLRTESPTQAFQFQLGAVIEDRAPTPRRARPFAAVDLRVQAENGGRVSQSYRAGVRLPGGPGNGVRISLGFDDGVSERGQRAGETVRHAALGLSFGD